MRERGEAGRQRCRVAAVKLIKWQREKELQRQGRSREREREKMGRRKGAASGGARQLTIAKNCHKAKLKTQKQTGKEIATSGASSQARIERCAGREQD